LEKRRRMMTVVITLMVLALTGVTAYYWYMQAHYVETDDARIEGSITYISPQITGKITAIYTAEGDYIREGDVIARQLDLGLTQGSNLDLAVMKSPVSGTIINKIGNVGEVGTPGQPVVMVCDLAKLFVTADIEETKLHKVQAGQDVEFTVDAFPKVKLTGHVVSIANASMSTFSLLPATNAGGSYTKAVQRMPVKISINDYRGCRLLPGMNVVVKIHVAG